MKAVIQRVKRAKVTVEGKTISEIGFELGFKEKAYFTSVFKKKAGQTPSAFRDEMKRIIS